jgi:hypothetical protein
MKVEEIISKLAKVDGWESTPEQDGTFMERVPDDEENTIHFVRPVATDKALSTSTRNVPDKQAFAYADKVLSFGASQLASLGRDPVTKITPFDSGIKKLDSFVALAPSIAQVLTADSAFGNRLMDQTIGCYAINHIEFAGSETEQEAIARHNDVPIGDLKREITPVIFARYQKQSGQRSHKHLAVGAHPQLVKLVEALPKDGGFVEIENWERVRLVFTADKAKKKLEAAFSGETKRIAVKSALELLEVLTHKDAKAAQKLWDK